jgi:orotate phosphoribosyltransferase
MNHALKAIDKQIGWNKIDVVRAARPRHPFAAFLAALAKPMICEATSGLDPPAQIGDLKRQRVLLVGNRHRRRQQAGLHQALRLGPVPTAS